MSNYCLVVSENNWQAFNGVFLTIYTWFSQCAILDPSKSGGFIPSYFLSPSCMLMCLKFECEYFRWFFRKPLSSIFDIWITSWERLFFSKWGIWYKAFSHNSFFKRKISKLSRFPILISRSHNFYRRVQPSSTLFRGLCKMVDFRNIVKMTTFFQKCFLSREIRDLRSCNPGAKKLLNFLKNRFISSESKFKLFTAHSETC